jgi:hypothetical protein
MNVNVSHHALESMGLGDDDLEKERTGWDRTISGSNSR